MFENLSEKLQDIFRKLRGKGKLTEENIQDALREVRRALLEADVNLMVVKNFINRVKIKALGQEVLKSITPGQQFIKIVHDEMVELLGGVESPITFSSIPPTIIMLVGLQGSGKTTTIAKLGIYLRKQGRRPLLVAADIYRPAAIKQLEILGKQVNLPVFSMENTDPVTITQKSIENAKEHGYDCILIDTAGRLHIDEKLMEELVQIKQRVDPKEILLVVDAMIGQDAVKMSETFNSHLNISGIIMSKLDGDTRGGAALSVKEVTGKPIKFITTGEKLDALDFFHPDRIATRILGMGDILTLVEKAQETIDMESARALEQKLRKSEFTLQDFMVQLKQVKKIGSLEQILGMIPGLSGKLKRDEIDESELQLKKIEAIINSMTPKERDKPEIIDSSRKSRIAKGSGTTVQEVNKLLKQFNQMKKLIKSFTNSGMFDFGMVSGKKGKKHLKAMKSMLDSQMKNIPF